jgi:hypothetical protein
MFRVHLAPAVLQSYNQPFLQGALVPSIGERCLETTIREQVSLSCHQKHFLNLAHLVMQFLLVINPINFCAPVGCYFGFLDFSNILVIVLKSRETLADSPNSFSFQLSASLAAVFTVVICLTCSSCLGLAQFSRSFAEIWNHQFLY